MALTSIAGADGSVSTIPSATHHALLNAWNLSFAPTFANVTGFGHAVERNRQGLITISGGARGVPQFDAADTAPFGGAGAAIAAADFPAAGSSWAFQVATACTFTGTFVTSIDLSSDKLSNEASINFSFRGGDSTAPTVAWDESP